MPNWIITLFPTQFSPQFSFFHFLFIDCMLSGIVCISFGICCCQRYVKININYIYQLFMYSDLILYFFLLFIVVACLMWYLQYLRIIINCFYLCTFYAANNELVAIKCWFALPLLPPPHPVFHSELNWVICASSCRIKFNLF